MTEPSVEGLTPEEEVLFRGVTDRYGMIKPADMLRVWATLDAARAGEGLDFAPPLPVLDCECRACDYLRRKQSEYRAALHPDSDERDYKRAPCVHGNPCRESMCVEYGRWAALHPDTAAPTTPTAIASDGN